MGAVKFDFSAFEKLKEQISNADKNQFLEGCTKELAARFITIVVKATPVGKYPAGSGKTGGTLRRGWTAEKNDTVEKSGGTYKITVANNTEYASDVEYGHRQHPGQYVPAIGKRLVNSYVKPQYFVQKSEQAFESVAPKVLQKRLDAFVKEVFNG